MSGYAQPFDAGEAHAVYRAIAERRDMRHFRPGPVDAAVLTRLLRAAHLGPSVGFMQPWRFIRLVRPELRAALHALVEQERAATADALGERGRKFLKLKVEGMRECGEIVVATLCDEREKHVFGRRTLPEMDLASVACAIQNMWLAARVEGIGLGWVSMFDPLKVTALLKLPAGSRPVAILCIGNVDGYYERPLLEQSGWAERANLRDLVFEDEWGVRTGLNLDSTTGPLPEQP